MSKSERKKQKKEDDTGASLLQCQQAHEPTSIVHADGKITGCANQSLKEWESLALIGKYAMESPINTKVSQYKSDHLDEKSLDLKIAQ
jgi:hypothetical protein